MLRRNVSTGLVSGDKLVFTFQARRITGNTGISIFVEGSGGVSYQTPITLTSSLQTFTLIVTVTVAGGLDLGVQDRNASGHGQIEIVGLSAKKVLPTFTNVFTPSTTFKDYTRPTPLTAPGWLCEPARTNYFTYSDQFDNAIWGRTRSSITANAITFIDGTLIADKLVEDTTVSNNHYIGYFVNLSSASATVVGSVYLKAGERTYAQLRLIDNAANVNSGLNAVNICADLASGVISSTTVLVGNPTNIGYGIDSLGNGWYRVWVRLTKKGDAVTETDVELKTPRVVDAKGGLYSQVKFDQAHPKNAVYS